MPNSNPHMLRDYIDKLLQWRRAGFWYGNLILIVTTVLQVGGIQKGWAMKRGKEKTYKEEAGNKEHFMFPTGFQQQWSPSLSGGVPESKWGFIMGSFAHVSSPNPGLLKHLPAKLNTSLAVPQWNTFSQSHILLKDGLMVPSRKSELFLGFHKH